MLNLFLLLLDDPVNPGPIPPFSGSQWFSFFFECLFSALSIVVNVLEDITFTINMYTLSLLNLVEYALIVSAVLTIIKKISYNGLFTIKDKKRDKIDAGADRFREVS